MACLDKNDVFQRTSYGLKTFPQFKYICVAILQLKDANWVSVTYPLSITRMNI